MGLTMEMRKGFAREKAKRYRQGSKKKKGQLIEEYMELVGCTRHHAAWTLRCWGITVWEQHAGRPVKIVVGRRRSRQRTARIYDQQTVAALTKLWRHFGYLCGKRLAAALRLWLPHYEGWNARSKRKIALTPEVRAKLLRWASRRVLAWRLSNTMDTEFCLAALAEALEGYGIPEIFNTDQGSQFTSIAFTGLLETTGIRCSMDGRGRCLDNVFIERLWRSLKYEAVYLHDLEDGFKAQRVIGEWMEFYNEQRPHSALAGRTPEEAYRDGAAKREEGVA